VQQLESRYQKALSQKDALIARQRRATSLGRVQSYLDTPHAELTRIERTIRRNEATAAATVELAEMSMDNQFRALDERIIEADLLALKQRLARATTDEDLALDELDALDAATPPRAIKSGLP
jgi:phage shock protein A